MEPDKSLRTLFNGALDHDAPSERARYLEEACGPDIALRRRVEMLLGAHDSAGGFFSDPSKPPSGYGTDTFAVSLTEKPGDTIGRYKLLQQIGEGGCGVVYMAEQEEPVRRRVALKVIKLGMDTKQVIARFEAERQALALMDHANIAKVLDAGATETGRPYFVMELVRGIRITDYCDQNNLPTAARLSLFTQVCQAIQHAHQKGIIHRDIKPSNILVTLHDGVPVAKVIDFGIARATTGQRLTDKTIFTAFEQFIGTPAYMSPEQAEMSGLDIDTRSDIYALGVLLYELLTGQTPFDSRELLSAGLDAMRRTIREQEPPRPSTRLSTMLAADLTSVAKHRQSESLKLTHAISGDLDWIVMKALEKDRTRRYETANGLALDIQRHLNNEPVTARPASNLYRFRKLVRRNKAAFAAAGAVAAALLAGTGVSTWQAVRATRAEQEQSRLRTEAEDNAKAARTEASKSSQVAQFLKDMLNVVAPSVALGRDTKMLREILDKTAERVGKDLKGQPEVEAELRSTIGRVYTDLGDNGKAAPMLREALAIRRKLFGNENPDVARSLIHLAHATSHRDEAEAMCREALAILRKLQGNESLDVANGLESLVWVGGPAIDSEAISREVLEIREKLLGDQHTSVALALSNLAISVRERNLAKAETMFREALTMYRKLLGNESLEVAESLHNLAFTLWKMDRSAEGEACFREALAMRRKLLGDNHPRVTMTRNDLVELLRGQDRLAEVEPLYREKLALARESGDRPDLEQQLNDLAETLYRQGKYAESEPLYRELVASRKVRLDAEDKEMLSASASLARLLSDWAWNERDAACSTQNPRPEISERAREAERILRNCLTVWRRGFGATHWRATGEIPSRLGSAIVSVAATDPAFTCDARFTEAEVLLLEGNKILHDTEDVSKRYRRDSLTRLVRLYQAWKMPDKAMEWQQKLDEFDKAGAKPETGTAALERGP